MLSLSERGRDSYGYRRVIFLLMIHGGFSSVFVINNGAKWLCRKPITSNRQVCLDRTVSIWTDLSCCCYDAFSQVFIAALISCENKSKLKETRVLFARFVSRIEIQKKDYNETNYHYEMLIKPGHIWYLQTKEKTKQTKEGKKSNEICLLVFGV